MNVSFEQDSFSVKVDLDINKQICIHMSESALDANGAAKSAFEHFDLFMRYYKFLGNRKEDWHGEKCLVKNTDGVCFYPHFGSERYFYSKDYDDKTLGRNSERVITKLVENVGRNDFYNINTIIHTHNVALASSDLSNAFLNLWSIMEIIGIDGLEENISRIKQVLKNIVPILKRNYYKRIIHELHDYLKCNIQKDQYNELLSLIEESGDEEHKIAYLVSLSRYEEERNRTYQLLDNIPLIRSRIYHLYNDVFKKKNKALAELNRYEKRITWHIQRLYRVRNSIIHSGEKSENLVYLVEHLHSYVDEVILEIIEKITQESSLGTIANVIIDAQVFTEKITKMCSKDEQFTAEEIQLLVK